MAPAKRVQLSKTELLKPKTKEIEVDGGLVTIRALNAGFGISLRGKTLGDTEIFDMVSKSICDGDGNSLLTPEEVGRLALTTLTQIVKGVLVFNSIAEGATEKAADDLKKTDSTIS